MTVKWVSSITNLWSEWSDEGWSCLSMWRPSVFFFCVHGAAITQFNINRLVLFWNPGKYVIFWWCMLWRKFFLGQNEQRTVFHVHLDGTYRPWNWSFRISLYIQRNGNIVLFVYMQCDWPHSFLKRPTLYECRWPCLFQWWSRSRLCIIICFFQFFLSPLFWLAQWPVVTRASERSLGGNVKLQYIDMFFWFLKTTDIACSGPTLK